MFGAISKAIAQMGDPRIQRLIGLSIAITIAVFIAVALLAWFLIQWLSGLHGWWAEATQIGGVVATLFIAWFTFPALAAAISALFSERVIAAVEAEYYPGRPAPYSISVWASILDGLKLALISLVANLFALVFLIPPLTPLYFVIAYGVNGFLLGREYYDMAAYRRLQRADVHRVYTAHRGRFTLGGVLIAFLSTIPVVNLIAPILATAFMVHLFESVVDSDRDRAASVTRRPPSGAH
ncbi:MAG TPA: EI24 domain-containing protein [Candidatus Cybelea sp.]|nr:EI24 domain-containing protein [Candidatus Cybelea sp.]